MPRAIAWLAVFGFGRILLAQPATWKEWTLAPAGRLSKPFAQSVEWIFAPAGTKVNYASCCPWLDIEGTFGRMGTDPWSLRASGISLKSLLARLEGMPQLRIVAPDWMSEDRYTLTAIASDDYRLRLRRREGSGAEGPREEMYVRVLDELKERLQLKMHREFRSVPVWVVKAGENVRLGQGPAKPAAATARTSGMRAWSKDGAFQTANVNEFVLLTWLQNTLKRPVFPAGLPKSPYQFEVKWQPGNERSLLTSLREQLGLELIEDRRELEFLVVEYGLKPEWR